MAETPRKTFVLVHGAWHGGWCWRRVADLLERKGHKVFTPTLTGRRRALAPAEQGHQSSTPTSPTSSTCSNGRTSRTSAWCVHSYGGWPGSGALEQIGDRVSSIVWLDAFKPENGQRGFDFASEFSRKALEAAVAKGEPGRPAPAGGVPRQREGPRLGRLRRLTPQPNGVALQPIKLTGAREKVAKKTYIRAPRYPQPAFDKAYAECKADKTWLR